MKKLIALTLSVAILLSGCATHLLDKPVQRQATRQLVTTIKQSKQTQNGEVGCQNANLDEGIVDYLESYLGSYLELYFSSYIDKYLNEHQNQLEDNYRDDFEDEYAEDDPVVQFLFFFEDQLDYSFDDLDENTQQVVVDKYAKSLDSFNQTGYIDAEYLKLRAELNQTLRKLGYNIPLHSLVDVAYYLKQSLTKSEYRQLIQLASNSLETEDEQQVLEDSKVADKIIAKYGLSAEQLFNQSISNSTQLGLYSINDLKIARNHLDTEIDNVQNTVIVDQHQMIWDKVKAIVPLNYLKMISQFEINTDGYGELSAYVDELADKTWLMSIDPKDVLDESGQFYQDGIWTIVHEMAHIISLNQSQMTTTSQDSSLYSTNEGTLKKDAYLNQYYHQFWQGLLKGNQFIEAEELYQRYPDSFVTEYAATNPEEDFSESFARFVIDPKTTDNSVKSRKILFFYQYPEFTKMRQAIRKQLNTIK